MKLDRWPSTPIKQITAWAFSVAWFLFSLAIVWFNHPVNEAIYYTLTGATLGIDVSAVAQYKFKRDSAWAPAQTTSEIAKPPEAGQPAPPARPGGE